MKVCSKERNETMARKKEAPAGTVRKTRPPLTPEAQENQMISLAMDLARKQLQEGTASSQVITHFLRLGTEKERLERVNLEKEIMLKSAKTDAIENAAKMDELYEKALIAFTQYKGGNQQEEYEGEVYV